MIVDDTLKNAKVVSISQEHPDIKKGTVGITKTKLMPTGKVIFNQKTYEATAVSGFIVAEKKVEIVFVEGNKITVKAITT